MKRTFSILAILCAITLSCEQDDQGTQCIEGVVLSPVCPNGTGFLGYSVFVSGSLPGATSYFDSLLGNGFVLAVLNIPQSYLDEPRSAIYFTARQATLEEIGDLTPHTANCDQPPLFVIEELKNDCTPSFD